LQPLSFFALLKARRAPRPATDLVPVRSMPARGRDRPES
jgi:hypothetical protein